MLMMAEAMIAKADPSAPKTDANLVAAKNIIDAIHKRSNVNKNTGAEFGGATNRDGYMKTLMNERQIEFIGEGRRWYDLVRYAERNSMNKIKGSVDDEGNPKYDENGNPSYEKSNEKDRDVIILYDPRNLTAIKDTAADEDTAFDETKPAYDLLGREVDDLKRGNIYIQNGKKVRY